MGLLELLRMNISFGNNDKYVKKVYCHEAHDKLEKFLTDKFTDTNKRIDDFMKSVDNYIDLLKNK